MLPDGARVSFGRLWEQSELASRALASGVEKSPVVGVVMSTSPEALACLVGGFRAGVTVASLPTPARAMPASEYRRQIETLCTFLGVEVLLVDAAETARFAGSPLEVRSFTATLDAGRRTPPRESGCRGSFVQLTSGTTAAPKGVSLSLRALATNVLAVLEALAPERGDVACSWLPLSHDLGLIGMCLVPWVANGPRILGSGDAVLLPPSRFGSWLHACSSTEATFTAAPSFALDLAARGRTYETLDLSHLRGCIVGAETVRASTLRTFEETASAAWGLGDGTLCPAYGLAEATLAVTLVRPGERWTERTVDVEGLADGRWEEVEDGRALVGNGRPVAGVEVRAAPTRDWVGPIQVRSEAMMSGYVDRPDAVPTNGWLVTRDLGRVVDGQLYVAGRSDDVIIVGGRNFYASDLELAVTGVDGIRPGGVVVLDDAAGRYVVVAERRSNGKPEQAAEHVRTALVRRAGPGPSAVVFVPRGSLPKTPSGKPQRYRVQALRDRGVLEIESEVEFAG